MDEVQVNNDRRLAKVVKEAAQLEDEQIEEQIADGQGDFELASEQGRVRPMCGALIDSYRGVLWRGSRSLANGDPAGWNDVAAYCATCVAAYAIHGVRTPTVAMEVAPAALLYTPSGELLQSLTSCLAEYADEAEDMKLAYFTHWVQTKGQLHRDTPKGPLKKLAEVGLNAEIPKNVLNEVIEFHLHNMAVGDDDDVELVNFEAIPVWWYALKQLRAAKKLATPVPDHPLFQTPFAQFPDPLPTFDPKSDERFVRLLALSAIADEPSKKAVPRKASTAKVAPKKTAKKAAKKSLTKKAATTKSPAKKAAKKSLTKKAATTKSPAKKAAAKKSLAKKAAAKKSPAKEVAAKKDVVAAPKRSLWSQVAELLDCQQGPEPARTQRQLEELLADDERTLEVSWKASNEALVQRICEHLDVTYELRSHAAALTVSTELSGVRRELTVSEHWSQTRVVSEVAALLGTTSLGLRAFNDGDDLLFVLVENKRVESLKQLMGDSFGKVFD